MIKLLALLLAPLTLAATQPLQLTLPSDNRALLEGKLEDYYMWVPRNFNGVSSKPWEAGQYGFVRTLRKTKDGEIIATKFHEGLDIKPISRDKKGNPLDEIRSIAKGEVVHTNLKRGGSNYGIYVVVKHNWGYGDFYSLYAHLSKVSVEVGQQLPGGAPIGIMGFTGAGINKQRSHLHLEICMMATENFNDWHNVILGAKNPHGNAHGMNLIGIDGASLFKAHKLNPAITIPAFLKSASPYFKVALPRTEALEIVTRYPWLKKGKHDTPSPSWEIAFTDSGIPLAVTPCHREVEKPIVTYVRTTRSKHDYYTRKRLTGTGRRATLTKSGQNFIALFTNQHTKPKSPSDDS